MKYLLDTNAIIGLIHKKEPLNKRVKKHRPDDFAISGFSEAELRFAIENSPALHRKENELGINLVISTFHRIYHDELISIEYGKIRAELKTRDLYKGKNEFDILIAATARAHGLILITNNLKDFNMIKDLQVADWSV